MSWDNETYTIEDLTEAQILPSHGCDKSCCSGLTHLDSEISLPKRTPFRPYPKEGNHISDSDKVSIRNNDMFESKNRQLQQLNKRFKKGKITEKNYLHQAKSIMN